MVSTASKRSHGGLIASELDGLGLSHNDILDVSANVNPYGPCEAVLSAIATTDIARYPDPTAYPARRALAKWLKASEDRVIVGNGAVDLMWTLARAWLRPHDIVLTIEPTFSEMHAAAERAGAFVREHRSDATRDFALNASALAMDIERVRPRLVYVCTPSNPAGRCTPSSCFIELATTYPNTLFVVDISFLSLSTHHEESPWQTPSHVVWLKSLTKDHALAGLRLGCAIAPPHVINRIDEERPPWSVNAVAQTAAIAIASPVATQFVAESRLRLLEDTSELTRSLERLGLRVHPSDTIFALVDLGTSRSATDLRAKLLCNHSVLVRDCTSFGLPHHVRIAARPAVSRARVLYALTEVLLQ
jgi:histidinol-phosphate/aromatic aminotransferase/cobyric acid decarboxylase-like protein